MSCSRSSQAITEQVDSQTGQANCECDHRGWSFVDFGRRVQVAACRVVAREVVCAAGTGRAEVSAPQATNHPLKLAGDLGLDVTGGNSAPAFMGTCSTLRGRADHERCGAMRLVSSRHPAGTAPTTSPKRANILSTRHTDAGPRRALRSTRNRPRTATRFRADVHHCSGVIGAARLRKN